MLGLFAVGLVCDAFEMVDDDGDDECCKLVDDFGEVNDVLSCAESREMFDGLARY